MDHPTEVTNCVIRVDTRFNGWHVMLVRVLDSIDGITYKIDGEKGTAQITGRINTRQLMKTLAEVGLHADLSPVIFGYGETNIPTRHGYDYGYHGGRYGYNPYGRPDYNPYVYNPYGRLDYNPYRYNPYGYHGYPPPRQTKWHPIYENYPPNLLDHEKNPYYEPPAEYFPQPPLPPVGFRNGDPEWCSIM